MQACCHRVIWAPSGGGLQCTSASTLSLRHTCPAVASASGTSLHWRGPPEGHTRAASGVWPARQLPGCSASHASALWDCATCGHQPPACTRQLWAATSGRACGLWHTGGSATSTCCQVGPSSLLAGLYVWHPPGPCRAVQLVGQLPHMEGLQWCIEPPRHPLLLADVLAANAAGPSLVELCPPRQHPTVQLRRHHHRRCTGRRPSRRLHRQSRASLRGHPLRPPPWPTAHPCRVCLAQPSACRPSLQCQPTPQHRLSGATLLFTAGWPGRLPLTTWAVLCDQQP